MIRVLLDAFYHATPGTRLGEDIVVGGYAVNIGRYAPSDCFHPNGTMHIVAELADEYDFRLLSAPYSDLSLQDADILVAANPDYPTYSGASPNRWTPEAVDALIRFLERGGGVLLLVNSFLSRPDYWEENFDIERVSILFDRLGIKWDPNFMSDDNIIEPATDGKFIVGYGQGGRVLNGALPEGITPLLTYNDSVYGFSAGVGKGKLVVLGDAGMISNGLACFPGFQNTEFLSDIFAMLKPSWVTDAAPRWDLKRFGHLGCAPSKTGLTEELFHSLRPNANLMAEHHYRNLVWNDEIAADLDGRVWNRLPINIGDLGQGQQLNAKINWLSIDGKVTGPGLCLNTRIQKVAGEDYIEIAALGRSQTSDLTWADLCESPEIIRAAGEIVRTHIVFQLKAVLDRDGNPRSASWNIGQIIYAHSPNALHYGYEILLSSDNGIIAPRSVGVV